MRYRIEIGATAVVAVIAGGAVALTSLVGVLTPLVAVLIVIAVGTVVVLGNLAVRNPAVGSVVLLALSFLCMRPMLFGERYSAVSIALALAALACAAAAGRSSPERSSGSVVLWVSLLWIWNLLLTLRPGVSLEIALRGLANVPLVIGATWIVTSQRFRRELLVKLVIGMVLATCASFVLTFALWELNGFGAFQIATIPAGYKIGSFGVELPGVPLYAPFTTTYGAVLIGHSTIPRLLGIGRESGIMGAVIAWCYFMLPRIGWNRLSWKLLLLIGLAATQSTASFGTFLVVFVLTRFLVGQRAAAPSITVLRQLAGTVALFGAGYLAIYAPVLGVQFKLASNEISFNGRLQAASDGLLSVLVHPLGQAGAPNLSPNAGINLIGALIVTGAPGLIFSLGALIRPFMLSQDRRAALGPVAVLLITCLTAQPLNESTAFFLLVMLACAHYGPVGSHGSTDNARSGQEHWKPGDAELRTPKASRLTAGMRAAQYYNAVGTRWRIQLMASRHLPPGRRFNLDSAAGNRS
jgi:hypothetical protein